MWGSGRNEGFRVKTKPKAGCGSLLSFTVCVTSGKFAEGLLCKRRSIFQGCRKD